MFKRSLWILIGTISCALGLIGVILPGLPTTPFLLLTLFAYSKGSKRFYTWFIQTSLYKKHLQSFYEKKSITRKQKKHLMLWSDLVVCISFITVNQLLVRVMLIGLIVVKYRYFHRYITIMDGDQKKTYELTQIKSQPILFKRIR